MGDILYKSSIQFFYKYPILSVGYVVNEIIVQIINLKINFYAIVIPVYLKIKSIF